VLFNPSASPLSEPISDIIDCFLLTSTELFNNAGLFKERVRVVFIGTLLLLDRVNFGIGVNNSAGSPPFPFAVLLLLFELELQEVELLTKLNNISCTLSNCGSMTLCDLRIRERIDTQLVSCCVVDDIIVFVWLFGWVHIN